jgi:hypothetical protein
MSTSIAPHLSDNYCHRCGKSVGPGAAFCIGCGTRIPAVAPITSAPPVTVTNRQEFEKQVTLAWSCLKDVKGKVEDISEAKNVADRAANDGTFRDAMVKAANQGTLHSEFNQVLDLAWKSAAKAAAWKSTQRSSLRACALFAVI